MFSLNLVKQDLAQFTNRHPKFCTKVHCQLSSILAQNGIIEVSDKTQGEKP